MREQWESNNELWQNRMKAITKQWNDRTEGVQYTMFEAMQTIMDYIEESFEKVMIPPTPGENPEDRELQNVRYWNLAVKDFFDSFDKIVLKSD